MLKHADMQARLRKSGNINKKTDSFFDNSFAWRIMLADKYRRVIMAYLLSRVVILIVWIIKWTLIKTRLIIPALFVIIILGFFGDWYNMNETLVHALFAVVIAGVTVSWSITLINWVKSNRRWQKRDVNYAYRIAGEPLIAAKREIE